MIPGSANPLLLASAAGSPAPSYQIERSLRFNSSDSAYLSRTPSVAGNRKTWTWAGWVKRSSFTPSSYQTLFSAGTGLTAEASIRFNLDDTIEFYDYGPSAYNSRLLTSQVFRDASAWFHVVAVFNSPNATADQRIRLYVNGAEVTTFSARTNPTQNYDGYVNNSVSHVIGDAVTGASPRLLNGYLADVHFIDGQALDPTSFGEFDTNGVWQPKAYTGTYGTNGFHLPFSDNSIAAALGTDTSGNGNDWTTHNLQVASSSRINWTSKTSITSGSIWGWSYLYWIFDANPATAAHSTGAITYSFAGGITVTSSLRLYTGMNVAHDPNVRIYIIINGTNYGNFAGDATWRTVGFTGTISTLTLQGYNSGNPQALETFLGAIEVDGVQLLDNAEAQNDSLVDTPTNYGTDTSAGGEVRGNYCTLNPLAKATTLSLSNGNLDVVGTTAGAYASCLGTFGMSSGKWYWEQTLTSFTSPDIQLGMGNGDTALGSFPGGTSRSYGFSSNNLKWNSGVSAAYTTGWVNGDIIGLAFDADAGTLTLYKNGVSLGVAFSGIPADTYFPAVGGYTTASISSLNFGQRPFAYPAPSGFKALCTTNLPAPLVAKPSEVMDVKLYTGNGGTQTISGLGFSPDLVWIKSRVGTVNHVLTDSVRGAALKLASNTTGAEAGTDNGYLSAFTSDGFTVAQGGGLYPGIETNYNPGTPYAYAAWCWDAGSSTVTNTQGSITSQVRANPSAGFSIVTYTGNGVAGATVGHGLGVNVALYFVKNRSASSNWAVLGHALNTALGGNRYLLLNSTGAAGGASQGAGNSSTIELWNDITNNTTGNNYVAYCFAPVDGYSSFGSYTGNGSADGPFVYTGFRPRWVVVKISAGGGGSWLVYDTARNQYNLSNNFIIANNSNSEYLGDVANIMDITSNGFKLRGTDLNSNGNGATYIYAAFAESPFQYARAR